MCFFTLISVVGACTNSPQIQKGSTIVVPTPMNDEFLLPTDEARIYRILCQGARASEFVSICKEQTDVENGVKAAFSKEVDSKKIYFGGLSKEVSGLYFQTCFFYSSPDNKFFAERLINMTPNEIEAALKSSFDGHSPLQGDKLRACLALADWYKKAANPLATFLGVFNLPKPSTL